MPRAFARTPTPLKQSRRLAIFWKVVAGIALLLLPVVLLAAYPALVEAKLPNGLLVFIGFGGLFIVRLLYQRGQRHLVASAGAARKQDNRPPVLYLRSFDADSAYDKFEQLLSRVHKDVGPLIAIGRPGEKLPLLGAHRTYVADADWQATVLRLISESRLVIIRGGRTDGLWWEIQQAAKDCRPEQLVFLSPSAGPEYDSFREKANSILTKPLPANAYKAKGGDISALVHFLDDWTPALVPLRAPLSNRNNPEQKLKYAFQPVFDRLGAPWRKSFPSIIGFMKQFLRLVVLSGFIAGIPLMFLLALIAYLANWKISGDTGAASPLLFGVCIALGWLSVAKWRDAAYWRTRTRLAPARGAHKLN